MSFGYIFLALITIAIWGVNFPIIHIGLKELSPLELCTLRFFLASVPTIFFVNKPQIPLYKVFIFSLLTFVLQFSALFIGMKLGAPPGLVSILSQSQVFFCMILAMLFFQDKPNIWQLFGTFIAICGILLIASHTDAEITGMSIFFILLAAFLWASGSIYSKTLGQVSMLSLIVWSCFMAWPILLTVTVSLEGSQIFNHIRQISWESWAAVLYIVYLSTLVGYGIWNYLLHKFPISLVTPFALLVPIFGILGSVVLVGESMQSWKLFSGLLVMTGVIINVIGQRLQIKSVLKPA